MTESRTANSDPEAETYFEGLDRGVILLQRCASCDRRQFPPRVHCGHCGGRELCWDEVDGAGTVYAKTVNRRAPEPAFEKFLPYVVALVDLDAGVRVMARADGPAGDVATAMRVAVFPDPDPAVGPGLLFTPEPARLTPEPARPGDA
jgi:uncharacterized OB-fold protein